MDAFFTNLKNWIEGFINDAQAVIFAALPDSPFKDIALPTEVQKILGYINWLVPFYMLGNVLLAWTAAIVIYYAYQVILRWIKAVQ